ncbi:MAG: hypothetical protein KDC98_07100 [Planctomycetes bacterium]|nr:hypothetical protein [Planctomycetota bacterium]
MVARSGRASCTMNLVLEALTVAGCSVEGLPVWFHRKLNTGLTLEVRRGIGRFEVRHECGKVLAAGATG